MSTEKNEAVIAYDGVDISYGANPCVRGLTVSVQAGEILGIVGESGSGKSTILKSPMGLLGPGGTVSAGSIRLEGHDLTNIGGEALRRLCGPEMAMIFQDAGAALCPIRTIGDQAYEAVAAHIAASRQDVKEKLLNMLARFQCDDGERIWDSYPFELSGGMNQRVAVAMAMYLKPRLLLADEPTSALDVYAQKQVVDELLQMRRSCGTAMIVVTHDIGVVEKLADSVLVLKEGQAVEYGPAKQVLSSPRHEYTKELVRAVPRLRREPWNRY